MEEKFLILWDRKAAPSEEGTAHGKVYSETSKGIWNSQFQR